MLATANFRIKLTSSDAPAAIVSSLRNAAANLLTQLKAHSVTDLPTTANIMEWVEEANGNYRGTIGGHSVRISVTGLFA
jgi:hypothetical protein